MIKMLFIGTGASMGIPVVGCSCHVCLSDSPYNQRFRPSLLLQYKEKQFLVDCGPDFRLQALRIGLKKLDGILLTHAHHDHIAGLDDLRSLYLIEKKKIPFLLSSSTAQDVLKRFHYLFNHQFGDHFDLQILEGDEGETLFCGLLVRYFSYKQMGMQVNGFRFGTTAYVSDIRDYSENVFDALKGVKTLILSALRFTSSPMHFSLDEAIAFARRVGAEQTFFTHISHELDHESTNAYLPKDIQLAYDGLEITIS